MNVIIALALIALGMAIDGVYQHRIRVAEVEAYETGHQQGLWETTIRSVPDGRLYVPTNTPNAPSMAPPIAMPPTFEERMRTHGRAVAMVKRGCGR